MQRLFSFAEVALMLDPSGKRLTARSIRSEFSKGRIEAVRVAGKLFITEDALDRFLQLAKIAPTQRDAPTSGSRQSPSTLRASGGTTAPSESVQRLLETVKRIRKNARNKPDDD